MKIITEAQYLYLKAKKHGVSLNYKTKEISDEEYEDLIQYSNKTITPINNDNKQFIYNNQIHNDPTLASAMDPHMPQVFTLISKKIVNRWPYICFTNSEGMQSQNLLTTEESYISSILNNENLIIGYLSNDEFICYSSICSNCSNNIQNINNDNLYCDHCNSTFQLDNNQNGLKTYNASTTGPFGILKIDFDMEGTEEPENPNHNPETDEPEEDNHDYSQDYLTFEALEDGTFSFTINDLYYSTNNGSSWKSLAAGTETELITAGTKVLWKRDSNIINAGKNGGIGTFSSTNKFNISGNILSLLINTFKNGDVLECGADVVNDNTKEFNNYALYKLFSNCKNLISAENLVLPNKTLYGAYYTPGMWSAQYYCIFIYSDMFEECTNLILPPKILPATILSKSCYSGMFKNCTSLIKAPILPAQNSGYGVNCYQDMFMGCTSLKYIKCLANNFSSQELLNWVKNVSETGTFIKNKDAVWDIGINGMPAGWEVIDEEVTEE